MHLKSKLLLTLTCSMAFALTGCAAIKNMGCSKNAAYANGVNDGQSGSLMTPDYAAFCDSPNKHKINISYRKGYDVGIKNRHEHPHPHPYHPHPHPYHPHPHPYHPQPHHHHNPYMCEVSFTNKVCGYGCVKDNFEHVYCGQRPHDTCVKDVFGRVKCGLNCHVNKFNTVECDIERYSKDSKK